MLNFTVGHRDLECFQITWFLGSASPGISSENMLHFLFLKTICLLIAHVLLIPTLYIIRHLRSLNDFTIPSKKLKKPHHLISDHQKSNPNHLIFWPVAFKNIVINI